MRTLGLDEAGRGCVLGPLVVGAFCVDSVAHPDELKVGATDSKKLSASAARRRGVTGNLGEHVQADFGSADRRRKSQPARRSCIIDLVALSPTMSTLTRRLIRRASPICAETGQALRLRGTPIPAFTIEPKADLTYPVVGAASIGAKLLRDARIAALGPVGSGYPSDPVTRDWLAGFLKRGEPLPDCVRTRWGTIEKLRQQHLF